MLVVAALYVGRGARSVPMARGENSGEGDLEAILSIEELQRI